MESSQPLDYRMGDFVPATINPEHPRSGGGPTQTRVEWWHCKLLSSPIIVHRTTFLPVYGEPSALNVLLPFFASSFLEDQSSCFELLPFWDDQCLAPTHT